MRRVVITGMGVVSPIGNDLATYWDGLKSGKCGIDYITKYDATEEKVQIAAEVKDFDPLTFMPKGDVRKTDLFTLYALKAAKEAMEDANLSGVTPERLGVYVGSGIGGIGTIVRECTNFNEGGSKKVSPYLVPMMITNIAAGNIAIKHNAKGECLPVVTACATSTHAIGEAYRSIKHGYCDAIIAGGAEASVIPVAIAGFTNCMALSLTKDPKEACVPFDKRRNGFVMGEGAGILILEEYENAVSRGAHIYAEVVGYGNTCDAHHVTAPHPEGEGATAAIKKALAEAGYEEGMELYINAHGTSTPLNDKTETLAIKNALGEAAYKAHISSTKSMTGHMLGAAGAVEAIASAMALEHGIVPPTIGYKEADEACDLNYTPNNAVEAKLEMAMSTSLGFGGHNAVIVLKKVEK